MAAKDCEPERSSSANGQVSVLQVSSAGLRATEADANQAHMLTQMT